MSIKIEGAVFDLDGTLLDSGLIWENVALRYLDDRGLKPTPEFLERYYSMTIAESSEYIRRQYGLSISRDEIIDGINGMIEHFYFTEVQPRVGVPELLEKLSCRNVPMCIATMTDRYLVEAALDRCGLARYFGHIFTCAEVGAGKCEPLIYERALEAIKTPRSTTYVFEDALYAVRTAKAAGFRTVAIRSVSEQRQDEMRRIADCYLQEMSDFRMD